MFGLLVCIYMYFVIIIIGYLLRCVGVIVYVCFFWSGFVLVVNEYFGQFFVDFFLVFVEDDVERGFGVLFSG